MSDNNFQIESLLRRYRPAPPPPHLKQRIFSPNPPCDPRSTVHGLRSTSPRPLSTFNFQLSTLHALRSTLHAPRTWLALAAAVLLLLALTLHWWPTPPPPPPPPPAPQLTAEQILADIQRAGQAAQLLALADILAAQPPSRPRARDLYHEIALSYPDLPVAAQAQARLQTLNPRSTTQ